MEKFVVIVNFIDEQEYEIDMKRGSTFKTLVDQLAEEIERREGVSQTCQVHRFNFSSLKEARSKKNATWTPRCDLFFSPLSEFSVSVKTLSGRTYKMMGITECTTTEEFKFKLSDQTGIPPPAMRLLHNSNFVRNFDMHTHFASKDSMFHLLVKLRGVGSGDKKKEPRVERLVSVLDMIERERINKNDKKTNLNPQCTPFSTINGPVLIVLSFMDPFDLLSSAVLVSKVFYYAVHQLLDNFAVPFTEWAIVLPSPKSDGGRSDSVLCSKTTQKKYQIPQHLASKLISNEDNYTPRLEEFFLCNRYFDSLNVLFQKKKKFSNWRSEIKGIKFGLRLNLRIFLKKLFRMSWGGRRKEVSTVIKTIVENYQFFRFSLEEIQILSRITNIYEVFKDKNNDIHPKERKKVMLLLLSDFESFQAVFQRTYAKLSNSIKSAELLATLIKGHVKGKRCYDYVAKFLENNRL